MKPPVKKRIEFPLFELMMIIILLGTLAIFALPKYISISVEARVQTLNATILSLSSANRLLYSRAMIKGVEVNDLQSTDILGEEEQGAYLVYGELRAQKEDLKKFLDGDLIDYSETGQPGVIRLQLRFYKSEACYIDYHQAKPIKLSNEQTVIQKASYKIKSTGC